MSQNYDGRRISTDINPIPDSDKVELRMTLVPAMLHLFAPGDKTVRAQVAESVRLIAELEFPERWLYLIDQVMTFRSLTDTTTNTSVLETAHSICAPCRAHVRSGALFSEINYVLSRFMDPFLQLFCHIAGLLLSPSLSPPTPVFVGQVTLLLEIYDDFTFRAPARDRGRV
ncbi:hypothetical protein FIBSPDRAFT_956614 [Athelia psychrophila]|uniref:Exportin-1/Importin-beta-like domain-containing protein n=1 Tax=Athelia psychrophila TaxID=1759441 RepID=A0A166GQ68_9AGAM|nr:hypothetical protein FIBSPDRAFT_956614 [Fibularhizoctonia sp. CBS 109695]